MNYVYINIIIYILIFYIIINVENMLAIYLSWYAPVRT